MNNYEDAVMRVGLEDVKEVFIPCVSKENQESIRVMAFNVRKKLPPAVKDMVGISKVIEDDKHFVRVYKRDAVALFERDPETGKLIPATLRPNSEIIRMTELMRKDGKTEEEILEALKEITE